MLSVKYEAQSMGWSVKCGVESADCDVESAECGV